MSRRPLGAVVSAPYLSVGVMLERRERSPCFLSQVFLGCQGPGGLRRHGQLSSAPYPNAFRACLEKVTMPNERPTCSSSARGARKALARYSLDCIRRGLPGRQRTLAQFGRACVKQLIILSNYGTKVIASCFDYSLCAVAEQVRMRGRTAGLRARMLRPRHRLGVAGSCASLPALRARSCWIRRRRSRRWCIPPIGRRSVSKACRRPSFGPFRVCTMRVPRRRCSWQSPRAFARDALRRARCEPFSTSPVRAG